MDVNLLLRAAFKATRYLQLSATHFKELAILWNENKTDLFNDWVDLSGKLANSETDLSTIEIIALKKLSPGLDLGSVKKYAQDIRNRLLHDGDPESAIFKADDYGNLLLLESERLEGFVHFFDEFSASHPYIERPHGGVDFYFGQSSSIQTSEDLIRKSKFIDRFLRATESLSGIDRNDFELKWVSSGSTLLAFGIAATVDPELALSATVAIGGIIGAATRCATYFQELRNKKKEALENELINVNPSELDKVIQARVADERKLQAKALVDRCDRDLSNEQQNALISVIKDLSKILTQGGFAEPKMLEDRSLSDGNDYDEFEQILDLRKKIHELACSKDEEDIHLLEDIDSEEE